MDIRNNRNDGVKWLLSIVFICILLGLFGQLARAQNYEQADSVGVIFSDSTAQLYFEWRVENSTKPDSKYSEPLDSATAANFAFNVANQAGNIQFQALQLLAQSKRIDALQSDVSSVLQALTGETYRQRAERQYINNLTPSCDSLSVCQGFYTFRQTGQANKILRIRRAANGNVTVREVNSQGNNVSGGLQSGIRFEAGTNVFELIFTAGSLTGRTVTFYDAGQNRNRKRWAALDSAGYREFLLIERKNLNDTGATGLGK